jgi:hypothetical protein
MIEVDLSHSWTSKTTNGRTEELYEMHEKLIKGMEEVTQAVQQGNDITEFVHTI